MSSWTHVPPPTLRRYVAAAQGYRVPANPTGVHRGLPSRHVTLVIELNAPLQVASSRSSVAAHGVVGGLHTAPAIIDASEPQEGIQLALEPLGCEALLGVPGGALAGLVVDLSDVLGRPAVELVDRLASTADWSERFRLVDEALAQRLGSGPRPDVTLEQAWRLIVDAPGRVTVGQVADRVGYSRRHLSERVRRATGVTPREAVRIARFEAARGMLLRPRRTSGSRIAADCGYADQAHLAREWKGMAGCTITTWLREELPYVQEAAPDEAQDHRHGHQR